MIKKLKDNWQEYLFEFVFFTMVLSIIILTYLIIKAPGISEDPSVRIKSDYVLMYVQCFLGVFALILPSLFEKRFKLIIPSNMMVLYVVFLYCAIFLGEVRAFYYNVPHWDTILHTFSGGMLGALGFSVVTMLNKTDTIPMNLSPLFVALFAFSFAVTLGVVWEIYEFTFDGVLHLNMQKFMLENGTQLVGRAALQDTMKDLIVDCLGALIISICGYISLKYKTTFITNFHFKKRVD